VRIVDVTSSSVSPGPTGVVGIDGGLLVPQVTALDQVAAVRRLGDVGFTQILTQSEASDAVPLGNVIRTEPAGRLGRARSGHGAERAGFTEADAIARITVVKLVPSATASRNCSATAAGTVINQTPAFGQRVAPGAGVTITVCSAS
jgi:beta-lactam-binding protein with PASTA domain